MKNLKKLPLLTGMGMLLLGSFALHPALLLPGLIGTVLMVAAGLIKPGSWHNFLAAALAPFLLFILLWLHVTGWNSSLFIQFGTDYVVNESLLPAEWRGVTTEGVGYDGQWYYYLAVDPLLKGEAAESMDVPAYRSGRILYPLVVKLLSLDRKDLIPGVMILTNLLAIALAALLLKRIAQKSGTSPVWALLGIWNLSLFHALRFSLAEPLYMLMLLLALSVWLGGKNRTLLGAGLLGAVLTRETALLLIPEIVMEGWRRREIRQILAALIPAFLYLLWQLNIRYRLGLFSFQEGEGNWDWPLQGVISFFVGEDAVPGHLTMLYGSLSAVAAIWVVVAVVGAMGVAIRSRKQIPAFSLLLYSLVPLLVSSAVWRGGTFDRILLESWTLLVVVNLIAPSKTGKVLVVMGAVMSLLAFSGIFSVLVF